jgi:hypothetical protein
MSLFKVTVVPLTSHTTEHYYHNHEYKTAYNTLSPLRSSAHVTKKRHGLVRRCAHE